ncbi:hypothetical protein WDZ92_50930, partial [Nostoc sp. NIES-2111]
MLRDRSRMLATTLDGSAATLHETIEGGVTRSIEALGAASERLKGEMGETLERVARANRQLESLVAGAGQSLGALEGEFGQRLSALQELLSTVAHETTATAARATDQVEALRAISDGALREAAELFDKLDTQGRSVAEATQAHAGALLRATRLLDDVEKRVTATLEERRAALDGMLETISTKTDDVQLVTRSFTSLVEDSLRAAETRAREIGGVIAQASQAGTD